MKIDDLPYGDALRRAGDPPPAEPVPWFIRQLRTDDGDGTPAVPVSAAAEPSRDEPPRSDELPPSHDHASEHPAPATIGAAPLVAVVPNRRLLRGALGAAALLAAFGLGWAVDRTPESPVAGAQIAAVEPVAPEPVAVAQPTPPRLAAPLPPAVEAPIVEARPIAETTRRAAPVARPPAAKPARPPSEIRIAARPAPAVQPRRAAATAARDRPNRPRRDERQPAPLPEPELASLEEPPEPLQTREEAAASRLPQCKGFQVFRPTTPCTNQPRPRRPG